MSIDLDALRSIISDGIYANDDRVFSRERDTALTALDALVAEVNELRECLTWYVENDDTNEGGKWEESNASWLEGKRRAIEVLERGEHRREEEP